ncbi:hypothetical protein ACHAPT_006051 [Fusarium lateritium]
MTEYQISCHTAGRRALRLRNLAKKVARQKPHDEEVQRRARAAIDFYHGVDEFGGLLDIEGLPYSIESRPASRDDGKGPVLPVEICQLIINYVTEWDYVSRQDTLLALCRSSKTLRTIAEPFLYYHPRDLDTVTRQWGFRYTLAIEPHLAALVKSLRLSWDAEGENGKLIIDVARACPNVDDILVQRGMDFDDTNHMPTQDVLNMAALLDACPQLTQFWYSTIVEWTSEQQRQDDESQRAFNMALKDERFAKAAQRLVTLTLHGQCSWLLQALSPHLSSNLQSLTLGHDLYIEKHPGLLSDLSRQSPFLRELELRCKLTTADELKEACKIWGPTLRNLRVWSIEELSDWVSQVMPFMTALQEVDFGLGCSISGLDLDAIGQSSPLQRLVSISVGDLLDSTDPPLGQTRLNEIVARIIDSHSSTLRELDISTTVGRVAVQSCKKAKHLVKLLVSLDKDVEASDVDDLLDACPDLVYVASFFGLDTPRRREWDQRRMRFEMEEDEEARKDRVGLGS